MAGVDVNKFPPLSLSLSLVADEVLDDQFETYLCAYFVDVLC